MISVPNDAQVSDDSGDDISNVAEAHQNIPLSLIPGAPSSATKMYTAPDGIYAVQSSARQTKLPFLAETLHSL